MDVQWPGGIKGNEVTIEGKKVDFIGHAPRDKYYTIYVELGIPYRYRLQLTERTKAINALTDLERFLANTKGLKSENLSGEVFEKYRGKSDYKMTKEDMSAERMEIRAAVGKGKRKRR